ncbi:hypothetical protein [Pseudomonas monteilii]|uniref:hypothetical protein n=1 Tax=Pseudomonas monteilii TaxID=76759 RepID=UPI001F1C516A|nr:hypothetical protein [Pseudomonas monteilii]
MIVEFDDVKALLGLEKTQDKYPELPVILGQVHAALENHCQRNFEYDEYSETGYLDGQDIPLRALPIASVKSVAIDGKPQLLDWRARGDRISFRGHLEGAYKVVYKGGFDEIPADVKRAAVLQACHEYQRKDQIGATAVNTDGGSVQYQGQVTLLKEVVRLLAPYRNYALGGW